MRLLIVTVDALCPEAPLTAVARALRGAGHTVFVAAPLGDMAAEAALAQFSVAGWLPLRQARGLLALSVNVWAVSRWARVLRPDILLADGPAGGVIANMARGAGGGSAVSLLMLDRLPATTRLLDRKLAAKAIQESDRLLVPEAGLREAFVMRGARRADTLVVVEIAEVAMLCESLEHENARGRPRPVAPDSFLSSSFDARKCK
ncbi:MAG TPA: hypothetical protein DEP84_22140 [Chloroflexi bacterium]|nr:hypothetical protein [Chloroflexota bacterium]